MDARLPRFSYFMPRMLPLKSAHFILLTFEVTPSISKVSNSSSRGASYNFYLIDIFVDRFSIGVFRAVIAMLILFGTFFIYSQIKASGKPQSIIFSLILAARRTPATIRLLGCKAESIYTASDFLETPIAW